MVTNSELVSLLEKVNKETDKLIAGLEEAKQTLLQIQGAHIEMVDTLIQVNSDMCEIKVRGLIKEGGEDEWHGRSIESA